MNCIILENTIIVLEPLMILEREDGVVKLYVPGLTEPHTFTGEDAHNLWKFYDNSPPSWKTD